MKKTALLCLVLFLFMLIAATSAFACSEVRLGVVIRIDGDVVCNFRGNQYLDYDYLRQSGELRLNETGITESCPDLMNETGRKVVFELLKSAGSEAIIEKQTEEEYSQFQKEMKKTNSALCDCSKIELHERKEFWTMYSYGVKDSCYPPGGGECSHHPPFYCPNSGYFVYFIPVLLAVLAGTAGIVFFFKKRKRKKTKK